MMIIIIIIIINSLLPCTNPRPKKLAQLLHIIILITIIKHQPQGNPEDNIARNYT